MGENKYVKDEWGKRGTYPTGSKVQKEDNIKPQYAAGGAYDTVGKRSPRAKEVKIRPNRHWGIRILLFVALMLFLGKYQHLFSISSIVQHMKNGNAIESGPTQTAQDNSGGVAFDYHLENLNLYGESSDSAEVAIRDFLNIYQIDYSDIYYDEGIGGYKVALNDGEIYASLDEVEEKGQELQKDFQTYCNAKYSNFGLNKVEVSYGYKQWK